MVKIKNAKIITPFQMIDAGEVLYQDGTIIDIGRSLGPSDEVIDIDGLYLSPGFIDIHIHGGLGYTFSTDDVSVLKENLKKVALSGTTSVLPVVPKPNAKIVEAYKHAMSERSGAQLLGIHMEAIDQAHVYPEDHPDMASMRPDYSDSCAYSSLFQMVPMLKMIGVDPGLPFAPEMTKYFTERDVKVAASHCGPVSVGQFEACVDAGMDSCTHIYSAMYGFYRDAESGVRYPGLIEDCLLSREIMCEVLADGVHMSGPLIDLVYRMKGCNGMYLATDSQEYMREDDTLESPFIVTNDGRNIHSFSVASLAYVVRETVRISEIPLTDAVCMASYNPAKLLGIDDHKGKIEKGYDADFIVFDDNLDIKMVIVDGKRIPVKPEIMA